MKLHYAPLALLTIVLLSTMSGCTRVNSGVVGMFNLDTDLKLVLDVGSDINPDEKHSPSPLYLRFYELSSDKVFERLDFLELYENDTSLLGKDLIAKQELEAVLPGVSRQELFVLNPETRYVAVFAEFYQYKNSQFKVVIPVTSKNVIENKLRIYITDNKLMLRSAR